MGRHVTYDLPEEYVSVDVETSGLQVGTHNLLSIGAVLVRFPDERFYVELKPILPAFDARAMQVNGLDPDMLARVGQAPRTAMRAFAKWVRSVRRFGKPVMVAYNAPFDWQFLEFYWRRFGIKNPFGYSAVCIKSFYLGLMGGSWQGTLRSRLDPLFQTGMPHPHTALEDALDQADMFRRMLEYQEYSRVTAGSS